MHVSAIPQYSFNFPQKLCMLSHQVVFMDHGHSQFPHKVSEYFILTAPSVTKHQHYYP